MNFLPHREPAVWIGLVVSIALAVQSLATGGIEWIDFVPLVAGIVTRFFVTPNGSVPTPDPAVDPAPTPTPIPPASPAAEV